MQGSSLQLAALALRIGLLQPEQFCDVKQSDDPAKLMLARGWLTPDELDSLRHLLSRCLAKEPPDDWLNVTVENVDSWDATPPPPMGDVAAPTAPRSTQRFRVKQLHATGGIGRVWLAEDEFLGRPVALKDLRPELRDPAYHFRFVEEAKITARLQHPGIVPVYELARDDDAQPFYVMRFVKGRTLQEAIRAYHEARRSKRAKPTDFLHLIEAFRTVCQTLAYAHAQGVLHRDLKPANIILGDFGEVLVLDWGLARSGGPGERAAPAAGSHDTHSQSRTATQAGAILGTPAYMSPEQAAGKTDAIDARSDVWGLGAILYEILTGSAPFRAATVEELLSKIQRESPQKPRAANVEVPAALEAVCLKALARDPGDRYASAANLAEEIHRFLADEPVLARREPITQRLGRWLRRHRTFVGSASALLITAMVALAISTLLVGQQRARAEANLDNALGAVETFYVQISEEHLRDEPGMQTLRAELLRNAVRYCEEFARENRNDPRRRQDLARVQLLLGRMLAQTEEPVRALETLEEARALYASLRQRRPDSDDLLRGEALAELNIGVLNRQSDPERAKAAYDAALEKLVRLTNEHPDHLADREKLGLVQNALGQYYRNEKQLDKALAHYEFALANAEWLTKTAPNQRMYQHDLAGILSNMGDVYATKGQLADARTALERSLDIRERLAQAKTKDLWLDEHRASSQNALGHLSMREARKEKQPKKLHDAEIHFRAALQLRQLVVLRNPAVQRYRQSLAWDHYYLSQALGAQNKTPAALAEIEKAINLQMELETESPKDTGVGLALARMQLGQGYFRFDSGATKPSIESFTQAIETLDRVRAINAKLGRGELVDSYWTRAMAHAKERDYARAVADYDRALELDDGSQRKALEAERQVAIKKRDRAP